MNKDERNHETGDDSFRAWGPIFRHMKARRGACPDVTDLLDYGNGSLTRERVQAIEDHLDQCGNCLLIVTRAREEPDEAAEAVAPEEWDAIHDRLKARRQAFYATQTAPVPAGDQSLLARLRPFFALDRLSPRMALILTASLSAVAILSLFVLQSRRKGPDEPLSRGGERQYKLPLVSPSQPVRNPISVGIPARDPQVRFVLDLTGFTPHPNYGVKVLDGSGEVVWDSPPLKPEPPQTLFLPIRKDTLKPGEYKLKVFGTGDGRETLLAHSAFRVTS